ncbi:MAG: DUF748 domain-containing protein [Thermoanaerobaculia bacterium]
MNLQDVIHQPRARKGLVVSAAVFALWAAAGFFVLPHFLRPVVERKLAESLHRPVTLRGLSLNPFTLSATLEGLEVKDRGGRGPFFSLERLYLNLEAVSLLRRAPVIRAITVTKPSLTIVRNADGSYNFQDLLEEKPKEKGGPFRFSVNNIRVEGGSVDFDDRPMRTKHTLRDVTIGIPFLSSIPSEVEITTEPVFEAKVNGSPFALHGKAKPLSATRETTLELDVADVDLPYYLAYLPNLPSKLTSGRVDARLTVSFDQPPNRPPALVISGTSAVRKLAVENGGKPVLEWDRLEAAVDSIDVFGRRVRLKSLKAVAPELWIRRERTGESNVPAAFVAAAPPRRRGAARAPAVATGAGPPISVEIAEMGVEGGRIHYDDFSVEKPFHSLLGDVAVSVKSFSTAAGATASLALSCKSDSGETLKGAGTLSIDPFALDGSVEIGGVALKRYSPFFQRLVTFDVDDGVLDLATKFRVSGGPKGDTSLSGLTAALRSPRLRRRGEKNPFFQASAVKLTDTSLDLGKRIAALGELSSSAGLLAVVRDKDGNLDVTNLTPATPPDTSPAVPVQPSPAASEERSPEPERPPPSEAPWSVSLGRLALDGFTVRVEDRAPDRIARYDLTKASLRLENVSTAKGSRGTLSIRFGLDGKGTASAKGPVGIHPTFAELNADVRSLPLVPLEAYLLPNLRLSLARGTLTGSGILSFGEDAGGKPSVRFAGKAQFADLLARDQFTKRDFFKWKTFSLEGLKAGYNPEFLQVARLGITGLGCDVEIEPDGTVNLSKIVGKPLPEEGGEAPGPPPAVSPANPAVSPVASPTASAAVSTVPASAGVMPIRIDVLTLHGGRVGLDDHFIKPSFSATLVNLEGSLTGLSSKEGTVARLALRGNLANHSPLEISGSVNPLAATAFADVKASFRSIDLPPFTAYSGKYAGYGIARGTLTMEAHYKLKNRKLAAENRFLVDQFELGEKVESKEATKLPVRLAVSLLKDKDGVIDLDLPIEGSLDDPKFRLGKVIWHVLGNLIGKAATAPFTLLGKLFGGSGQELSSVDFADGSEALGDAAKGKLDALARALSNRPALKLEATGRFSAEKDLEALRRLRFDRKIKAQKLADLAKRGEAPASVDDVVVAEKEYPIYLQRAYRKEKFRKPRNVLGMAKDLPAAEMEKLMLANPPVTTDDLRQLALARANSVKDYLTGPGKVEAGRVFVREPGGSPSEPAAKAGASRVDFTLK